MSKRAQKKKKSGREPILTRTKLRKIIAFKKKEQLTNVEVASQFGIGVNTIYNTVNRYKEATKKSRKKAAKKGVNLSKKQAEVTA